MNRRQFIEEICKERHCEQIEAEVFLESFESVVKKTLRRGEKVWLSGFGTFIPYDRKSRRAANPLNPKETIVVPDVRIVKFRPGCHFKEAVKNHIGVN